jgi:hypothetical protein
MSEQAGWGAGPWLPPSAQRQLAREAAREALEAREAEADREDAAETRRAQALQMYRSQAELRGEDPPSVLELAAGAAGGRSLGEIFAGAIAAADRQDARERARLAREDTAPLPHVFVGEAQLAQPTPTRGAVGLQMFNRYRHWKDAVDARRRADELEARRDDFPLARPVSLR